MSDSGKNATLGPRAHKTSTTNIDNQDGISLPYIGQLARQHFGYEGKIPRALGYRNYIDLLADVDGVVVKGVHPKITVHAKKTTNQGKKISTDAEITAPDPELTFTKSQFIDWLLNLLKNQEELVPYHDKREKNLAKHKIRIAGESMEKNDYKSAKRALFDAIESLKDWGEADPETSSRYLAMAYGRLGVTLKALRDDIGSKEAMTKGISVIEKLQTLGDKNVDSESRKARALASFAVELDRLGRTLDSAKLLVKAFEIWDGEILRHNHEFDSNRAMTLANISKMYRNSGLLEEAKKYAIASLDIWNSDKVYLDKTFDQARVQTNINLAATLRALGEPNEALKALKLAESMIPENASRNWRNPSLELGRVQYAKACALLVNEDLSGARAALKRAIAAFTPNVANKDRHFRVQRARAHDKLAEVLVLNGELGDAKRELDKAITEIQWQAEELGGLPEIDLIRAQIQFRMGEIALSLGSIASALGSLELADRFYHEDSIGERLLVDSVKCRLFSVMSLLVGEMAAPEAWTHDKSGRLVDLVDLAPADEVEPWTSMRRNFAGFHANWLRFALSESGYAPEVIAEILSAIQGRNLVAEVLEAALLDDGETPEPVRMLAQHKQRMREVLEQIREDGEMGLTAGMLGVDGAGGMRMAGLERLFVPKPSEKSQEELRVELRRLRDELPKLKAAGAQVEGFEILDAPHTQITTERLQAVLGDGEALALAFTHGGPGTEPLAGEENPDLSEKGYLFVLRSKGKPELITCAALPGLASRFSTFTESLPETRMRRGAWSVRGPESPPSGDGTEIPKAERLSPEEMDRFWEDQGEAMRETLWDPLVQSGVLKGVDRILLATAGDLHNLPFEPGREAAGAPEMVHVNSLAMFALGRGLYKQTGKGKAAKGRTPAAEAPRPVRKRAALLCWPGSGKDRLAFAEKESEEAAALWAEALGNDAVVSAARYALDPEEELDLLHVACHGGVLKEEDRTPRPVMRLKPDGEGHSGLVGEREYLRGPKAREVLMNICVGGQVFDDSFDGNPTGLVAGALRHGAQTVVASLPPVPDEHGYVFGVLVTLLMTKRGLSLAAATGVAKRAMARTPRKDDQAEELVRLLAETRARRLFPLMTTSPEYRQEKFTELLEKIRKGDGDPAYSWLTEDLAARVLADPPASLDDLTTLIAEIIPLVSDRARNPAADGIITYGITIFGDPESAGT